MTTFTEQELLDAIRAAVDDGPEDARTCSEWADAMGVSLVTMRHRIGLLIRAGRMEHVKVRRMRINGAWGMVDGYRVIPIAEAVIPGD